MFLEPTLLGSAHCKARKATITVTRWITWMEERFHWVGKLLHEPSDAIINYLRIYVFTPRPVLANVGKPFLKKILQVAMRLPTTQQTASHYDAFANPSRFCIQSRGIKNPSELKFPPSIRSFTRECDVHMVKHQTPYKWIQCGNEHV